jgi:hypothetical protein
LRLTVGQTPRPTSTQVGRGVVPIALNAAPFVAITQSRAGFFVAAHHFPGQNDLMVCQS